MQQFFIPYHLLWLLLRRNDLITQGAHDDKAPEPREVAAPAQEARKPASTGMVFPSPESFLCGLPSCSGQYTHSDDSFGKREEDLSTSCDSWQIHGLPHIPRIFRACPPFIRHLVHIFLVNTSTILFPNPRPPHSHRVNG